MALSNWLLFELKTFRIDYFLNFFVKDFLRQKMFAFFEKAQKLKKIGKNPRVYKW